MGHVLAAKIIYFYGGSTVFLWPWFWWLPSCLKLNVILPHFDGIPPHRHYVIELLFGLWSPHRHLNGVKSSFQWNPWSSLCEIDGGKLWWMVVVTAMSHQIPKSHVPIPVKYWLISLGGSLYSVFWILDHMCAGWLNTYCLCVAQTLSFTIEPHVWFPLIHAMMQWMDAIICQTIYVFTMCYRVPLSSTRCWKSLW